ncbi:uncharacterized protein LOC129766921 [Toxorhynchites rutilus septentrionalis]|uniref:uncharacterized protein LOC129766921 n=1 Tax=Toxorhynchites rutilus septentrionalis TaxID=329112 RepID=UPI00247A25AC|nr:uncharacterized protein LOC129766921 [Toxorhynchites rutilus septentrionalis]
MSGDRTSIIRDDNSVVPTSGGDIKKQWSQVLDVIIGHIATDCVINGNIPYLKVFLNFWVFQFDLTRDAINDETEALKLKMFPCPMPKHWFCQNEIPTYLIRSFFAPDPRIDSCDAKWAREAAPAPGGIC